MLNTINNHKSIRKYKSTPVDASLLTEILTAGTRASTTGNMQVYSIVSTTSAEIKEKLWAAHFKQEMVRQAPVVLTFCADFNRFNKWCLQRKAQPGYDNFLSFFTAAIDALLVSQNVALAAEDKGLGICYLGTTTYMADTIIDILNLPIGVVPVTTLVLGYPDETPELTDRLPLAAVLHQDTYHDYSTRHINELYKEKENLDMYRQLIEQNKTETLAQIFTDKRYTKKDNLVFSEKLINTLVKQGFMNIE